MVFTSVFSPGQNRRMLHPSGFSNALLIYKAPFCLFSTLLFCDSPIYSIFRLFKSMKCIISLSAVSFYDQWLQFHIQFQMPFYLLDLVRTLYMLYDNLQHISQCSFTAVFVSITTWQQVFQSRVLHITSGID